MTKDLRTQLADAFGIETPAEAGAIQAAYNTFVRKMCPITVDTPLPEKVSFMPENFPHLVKLETQIEADGKRIWVNAKWPIVGPLLEQGIFSDDGYRSDPRRVHALQGVLHLLRSPHRIHVNLRHGQRGPGVIRGRHVYVREHGRNEVWVAFTLLDPRINLTIVTSSFYTNPRWLTQCAEEPCIFSRERKRS
jgi:hypothetical protein